MSGFASRCLALLFFDEAECAQNLIVVICCTNCVAQGRQDCVSEANNRHAEAMFLLKFSKGDLPSRFIFYDPANKHSLYFGWINPNRPVRSVYVIKMRYTSCRVCFLPLTFLWIAKKLVRENRF